MGVTYHSLRSHQVNAALNDRLVELHAARLHENLPVQNGGKDLLRNTVHEQTTHTVVAVVHGDPVTGLVQLVGSSETRRTRANDSDLLPSPELRYLRSHPAHLEALTSENASQYECKLHREVIFHLEHNVSDYINFTSYRIYISRFIRTKNRSNRGSYIYNFLFITIFNFSVYCFF